MQKRDNIIELIILLTKTLAQNGYEYSVGGAIAAGFWGIPRTTIDVDITVFITFEEIEKLFGCLKKIGCEINDEAAVKSVKQSGYFRAQYNIFRLDIYLPDIEFYESAKKRRIKVQLENESIWVWSPEDIVLFKLLYFRTKDKADIEGIVKIYNKLDIDYINQWLEKMLGKDDERISWWKQTISSM